jgi:hypothetical protein
MPLSDLIQPRLIELGKIKIGSLGEERKSSGGGTWRLPQKLDHFLITTMNRDKAGSLIQDTDLMEYLASQGFAGTDGKLRELPISLLSNDVEDVMQSAYVWYEGKKCAARSDGKTLTKLYDGRARKWLETPEEVDWKPEYAQLKTDKGAPRFKLHSTFNCIIAAKESRWGGVYKLRTTSVISAQQLYSSILHIRELTGGVLRGLPLRLVVRPVQVSPDGKTSTVYVVHVELRGSSLDEVQQLALKRAQFELANRQALDKAKAEYKTLLALPGYRESAEEQSEIAQEFHPETFESAPPAKVDPLTAALGINEPAQVPEKEVEVDEFGVPIFQDGRGDAWVNSES